MAETMTNEDILNAINGDEELITEEALHNMQEGKFEHTMLEMWMRSLQNMIRATGQPINLEVATSILQAYPWLKHSDLHAYKKDRTVRLQAALDVLIEALGDKKEKIFEENEDDWLLHSEIYLEVLAGWNRLARSWDADWGEKTLSRVTHAGIVDVVGILLNDEFGLVEGLRNLADFEMTTELREKLKELLESNDE